MAHGKTLELRRIGPPMYRGIELIHETKGSGNGEHTITRIKRNEDGTPVYNTYSQPIFKPPSEPQENTLTGLDHAQTNHQYCADVRNGNAAPTPTGRNKKPLARKRAKAARKMRKFNTIHSFTKN